jgi:hypothetical protein
VVGEGTWFPEGHEGWGWQRIVGELRKILGFLAAEERPMVSCQLRPSRDRSYAAVLSSSIGGLKSQPEFHLDLCPMAPWHKLAKGSEVARSLVICFEFELGAQLKKNDTGLGSGGQSSPHGGGDRSGLRGGDISQLKALRVSRVWKIMLEKIRLNVDRVFSRLGLRLKVPLGFRLQDGRRLISFIVPRLESRPKILNAALEPCSGLYSGVGRISGQLVP